MTGILLLDSPTDLIVWNILQAKDRERERERERERGSEKEEERDRRKREHSQQSSLDFGFARSSICTLVLRGSVVLKTRKEGLAVQLNVNIVRERSVANSSIIIELLPGHDSLRSLLLVNLTRKILDYSLQIG